MLPEATRPEAEFRVYEDHGDTFELTEETTIRHHRKMFPKDETTGVQRVHLYDINIPGEEKPTEMIFVPEIHPQEETFRTPGWLRKEKKRDKRAWRQIHATFRRTEKWAPEYFEPLPEVPKAELKYTNT